MFHFCLFIPISPTNWTFNKVLRASETYEHLFQCKIRYFGKAHEIRRH